MLIPGIVRGPLYTAFFFVSHPARNSNSPSLSHFTVLIMHHLCLITPQPLSKCCSCNNSNKNLCFFCLSLFLFSSSLYVVETKKEKKGSADKFKAEGSHRCAFVLSQRRARLYETVTQLRGEWWTAQFGFVTLRHTKQNRWPTASHPGSDIKQFCFFPAVLHFQHVFFFFFF